MRKGFVLLLLIASSAAAQKKEFTSAQLFKNSSAVANALGKSLPVVRGWVDDKHYIEQKYDSGVKKFFSVDVKTGKSKPYTGSVPDLYPPGAPSTGISEARNVTLSPDGKWVAYTNRKDNNLYAMELASKKVVQFTRDGSETILNGYASWVYYEEILGRASEYRSFWWSPDSKHIAFMRANDTEVPMFPIYNAEGTRGSIEKTRYPKVGDKNPEIKIGIVSVDNPAILWADFDEKDDQYFGMPYWTPGGQLWVQWMPRSQDNLKVYKIDLSDGSKKEIYNENQETWISLDETDRIEFLSAGKGFILKSDKDGWQNLYLHDMTGKQLNQITTGNFWSTSLVKVDEKTKQIWFRARRENSARFDFYRVGFNGKNLVRLSFGEFSHDQIILSPNGKYFITTYSNVSTPPVMAIGDAKGKLVRILGDSKSADFDQYELPKTELVRIKSADGVFDLPMTITYPTHFDPKKKYPVVMSVYGGPDAETVYDKWKQAGGSTQWWAQEGIIQVAMDNRSSGHFGKVGLNYIHRQLGKWEIEDFMQGARWLQQKPFVAGDKICITGASFGGYMTCMALTYGADVFSYGIANASVTDWMLYDTHYTERFMDKPEENSDGYKNTSVMTYADKYKGLLRILHGTTDDNVHMQNSLQLINKLEKLGKHFEFMLYPGERHGIGYGDAAKGKHLRMETFRFYYNNLLNREMPAGLLE